MIDRLPTGWREERLGDIADEITVGHVGSMASEYLPAGIPFLRSQDVEPLRIRLDGVAFIGGEFHDRLKKSSLRPGDVVIVRTGKPGAAAVIPESLPVSNCSDLVIVRPGAQVDSRFLAYYVNTVASQHVAAHLVGAVQQHFNVGSARQLRMLLPSLSEQKAIAHILGTLDDKIELNRRMNQTLEQMARAIFKSWFVDFDPVRAKAEGRQPPGLDAETGALFPDSFTDSTIGPIPKGWTVGVISDLAEVSSGKRPAARYADASRHAAVPLWGGNGPMGFVPEALVAEPIIVTGRVGTLGSVFRVAPPCWPSDNTLVLRARSAEAFEYIFLQLERVDFLALNRGSTQPLLTQTDLKAQTALIPEGAILRRFHELTRRLYARTKRSEQESHTLAAIRDALLPKLLSGEIRVPVTPMEVV